MRKEEHYGWEKTLRIIKRKDRVSKREGGKKSTMGRKKIKIDGNHFKIITDSSTLRNDIIEKHTN